MSQIFTSISFWKDTVRAVFKGFSDALSTPYKGLKL